MRDRGPVQRAWSLVIQCHTYWTRSRRDRWVRPRGARWEYNTRISANSAASILTVRVWSLPASANPQQYWTLRAITELLAALALTIELVSMLTEARWNISTACFEVCLFITTVAQTLCYDWNITFAGCHVNQSSAIQFVAEPGVGLTPPSSYTTLGVSNVDIRRRSGPRFPGCKHHEISHWYDEYFCTCSQGDRLRGFTAAGFVMLLYDHALAISDERLYLWKAPPSFAKYAFILNRYLVPSVGLFLLLSRTE